MVEPCYTEVWRPVLYIGWIKKKPMRHWLQEIVRFRCPVKEIFFIKWRAWYLDLYIAQVLIMSQSVVASEFRLG